MVAERSPLLQIIFHRVCSNQEKSVVLVMLLLLATIYMDYFPEQAVHMEWHQFPMALLRSIQIRRWEIFVNLSEYRLGHPVANPPADFEPDGTWYSLIAGGDDLFALDPNTGELVKISSQGEVTRVADFSATVGHVVPTAIVWHQGNFYVGNLNVFPITGNSSVYKVTPSGEISVVATGFSTILGIDFDKAGGMYVLENTTGNPFPNSGYRRCDQDRSFRCTGVPL